MSKEIKKEKINEAVKNEAIKVENLTKSYKKNTVLENMSLSFEFGKIYGLVGVNGCGKTTLMRCICGFAKPTSGSVTVLGKRIGHDCDFAPSTGVIIETPGFLPHKTAMENMRILASQSKKVTESKILQVISMVGLDLSGENAKKPVGKFSLGMRQRLGIAQAIMEDPEILILDEPFNGLDKYGVADIHQLFQQLKGEGKCIILASHSAGDIAQACDVVLEMENGKISETKL